VSYLGYFSEDAARAKAAELRAGGADVFVGGVPAYSTLGWFDDPLLSTFLHWPESELARLLFHELAHQVVYVKDDTEFNESFAAAVEEIGVRRYLAQAGKEVLRAQFDRAQIARADFGALVLKTRDALVTLYASALPDAEKLTRKRAILEAMQTEYREIKMTRWGGFAGYDRWFAQDINNAALNSIGLYKALVPAFLALADEHAGNLPAFYAAVAKLAKQPPTERRRLLTTPR
jgi:predicted aminopeptidase